MRRLKKQRITRTLKDIQGNLIAKEGALVTPELLKEVIAKGRPFQKSMISLNKPVILNQAKAVMKENIYREIFKSPKLQERILEMIKKSKMQKDLYQEMMKLRRVSGETFRHCVLTGVFSTKVAMDLKSYGYRAQDAFTLALTHDIGKTRLPVRTLNKKSPLTSNEYRILHSYPNFSLVLLYYYLGNRAKEAIRVAYEHHEKLDGSGYPKGIKTMSKYTRIVAVIDIFDALVAHRPYRKRAFTVRGALDKLIVEMHEGKLPKLVVRLLVRYFRRGEHNFRTMKVSLRSREQDPSGNSYGKVAKTS